ncbi:unnamed protein product [Symbiodinium natans]|uniref:Uncharacterized protein n=1 Tax=Symbiodinium natans TaxID=878477 RepID=A0A812M2F0_9DINO|nr:unnamed protein product [Symbiodinium natans]
MGKKFKTDYEGNKVAKAAILSSQCKEIRGEELQGMQKDVATANCRAMTQQADHTRARRVKLLATIQEDARKAAADRHVIELGSVQAVDKEFRKEAKKAAKRKARKMQTRPSTVTTHRAQGIQAPLWGKVAPASMGRQSHRASVHKMVVASLVSQATQATRPREPRTWMTTQACRTS